MATCKGVEQGVRFITDGGMARVLAGKVNEQTVDAVRGTLRGVHKILDMSLTIIEKVIGFMIDTYRSLLMCTIEFVVKGSLAVVIGVVEAITDGITKTLNGIRSSIQADVNSANTVIATAIKAINSVTSLVNVNLDIPQFDIPSLDSLANVSVPTGFEDDLRRLNASLPTLDEFRTILQDFIVVPFERLREEMDEGFKEVMGRITVDSLPTIGPSSSSSGGNSSLVARAEEAYDLCAQMDTSFLDDIASSLSHLAKVATGLLVLAFLLVWAGLIFWEWYTWKQMVEQASEVEDLVEREVAEGRRVDGLRMVQMVEHPVVEKYGGKIVRMVTRKKETTSNLRWFLAYITHPPALLLLAFGILTFLTMQIQLSAVHALRERSTAEADSAIAAQSKSLGEAINQAMFQQSGEYATDMNRAIQGWQEDIDRTIFGPWLNTTTVTLNTTLIEFYDKVENVLNATFGRTILGDSVNRFVYCILGSKIDNLVTALTWIKDNAKVTLPNFNLDVLMLSGVTMDSVADPIAKAAAGSGSKGSDDDQGVIGKLFDRYEDELRKQRNIAAIFIGLYGVVMLVGLAVFVWHTWLKRPFVRWRMQRRGLDLDDTKPSTTVYYKEKTEAEKAVHLGPAIGTAPPHSIYPAQGRRPSQRSFFDDSDAQPYPDAAHGYYDERPPQSMADRMRALSPIRRSTPRDDYDEPMLPSSTTKQDAQPSTLWQGRLENIFGGFLALPILTSKLSRSTSQKSAKTETSWTGASSSPGPSKMFQISGPSTFKGYGMGQPVVSKPIPSPLQQNPFSLGDDDEVGTPIAARFAHNQPLTTAAQNSSVGRHERSF